MPKTRMWHPTQRQSTDIDHTASQLTPADDGLRANELEFIKNNLTILMANFIVF